MQITDIIEMRITRLQGVAAGRLAGAGIGDPPTEKIRKGQSDHHHQSPAIRRIGQSYGP